MQLSAEQLETLRAALERVRNTPDARVAPDVLVELSSALPEGTGMTVDFHAEKTLGHPMVVLRPSRESPALFADLSARELEVAGLVAAGLRNADIALALGIKLGTVKDHVHKILTKSGLDGRSAIAAEWTKRNG